MIPVDTSDEVVAPCNGLPPGWVMVPMEPTQEQIRAAIERPNTKSEDMYHSIYRAMVGAAKLDDEE